MALALEGIAGALHAGRPVEPKDLGAAAVAAEKVWEAGPEPDPVRNQEFQAARATFITCVDTGARGGAKEAAALERAAQGMALQLRATAQEAGDHPGRASLPAATSQAMAQLASKYGRFGMRPAAS